VVGGNLFALSNGTVTVHSLENPAEQLGSLELDSDESELTTLVAWTASEISLGPAPELVWTPIDEFVSDPTAGVMGPSAEQPPDESAASEGADESSETATTTAVGDAPEQEAAAENRVAASVGEESSPAEPKQADPAPTSTEVLAAEVASAEFDAFASVVVVESASTATVETVEATASPQASDNHGVVWLAQGQATVSALRASRATAPERKHGRDESGNALVGAAVQLAASVAARQQLDLLSRDAAFEDDTALFGAWDEALELPGIGPLLA
jgi:hypothetical protein